MLSLSFIPVGDSAYAYVTRCANGDRYFLKVFDETMKRGRLAMSRLGFSLTATRELYTKALFRNLTYPMMTLNGSLVTRLEDATLVLFNFIEGETLADAYPFSDRIHDQIANNLADIHRATPYLSSDHPIIETFDIPFDEDLLRAIDDLSQTTGGDNPFRQELYELLIPEKQRVIEMLAHLRQLQNKVKGIETEMFLCHGDVWGGNLIVDAHGELYFLDWEGAKIAPVEYDFQNYVGNEFERFAAIYTDRLGRAPHLNASMFGFYLYRRHLKNLANWVDNIMYENTDPTQNRNDLEMIANHCMNRWDGIEPSLVKVAKVLASRL